MSKLIKLIAWIKSIFARVVPATLPTVAQAQRIYDDNNPDHKVSALFATSAGLIAAGYHNITRRDSWLVKIGTNGQATKYNEQKRETQGTPDKVGDTWWLPSEAHDQGIMRLDDKTGKVTVTSREQPDTYSTRALGSIIPFNYKGRPIRVYDCEANKTLQVVNMDKLEGIVSGMCRHSGELILSVMDGSKPGIYSVDKGWVVRGSYPEVASFQGKLLGFHKNGEVHEIKNGKVVKVLARMGNKWQRVRVNGGLLVGTTCNRDQVWAFNGSKWKMIYEWKDEPSDSTTSGSLFNTSLDWWGNTLCVARSIDKRGWEVIRLILK